MRLGPMPIATLVPATALALVATLIPAGAAVAEPQAPSSRPAVATLSGTTDQFIQRIPAVEPIGAGYKGTSSFIPASVATAKDKRGCNLRQKWLISSAYVKPKVGKKCTLKGGVWWVNGGTEKVTKAKDVAFLPIMSLGDAWGQGASQWTAAQRTAWATSVQRGVPLEVQTRAKAVSRQVVPGTQQLISDDLIRDLEKVRLDIIKAKSDASNKQAFCNKGPTTFVLMFTDPYWFHLCSDSEANFKPTFLQNQVDAACASQREMVQNVVSWGLSLGPTDVERLQGLAKNACPQWESDITTLVNQAQALGIVPIPKPQAVETQESLAEGGAAGGAQGAPVLVPFASDSAAGTPGDMVSRQLFGVVAPVDWGLPGVPVGSLRLWDAGVSWRQVEKARGVYDWKTMDRTVAMAKLLGAKLLYVLGDTPEWANGGQGGATPPTSLGDAADFVLAMCTRYGGAISGYEVWNEGNLDTFWTGTMRKLAELTVLVNAAVDMCHSGAKVYAASTGTRASNAFVTKYPDYLRALADFNWPVDGYTVHSYPAASGGPKQRIEELAQFKTILAQNGAPVRAILDTELNYGLAGLGQDRRAIDEATGAAYMAQSYIQSVQYGVDTLFWFLWTKGDYDKLGIQFHAGTPLAMQAWNRTQSWLVGSRMTRCSQGRGLNACQLLTGGGEPFTLLWADKDTVFTDITGLGSTLELLDGSTAPVPPTNVIPVGIDPVAVFP